MKQPPSQTPLKDERDEQIAAGAKSCALEWATAVTQILTVICLVKGNSAWKGTLSILFFSVAFSLFYKGRQYKEQLYQKIGAVFLLIGTALLVWFGITG